MPGWKSGFYSTELHVRAPRCALTPLSGPNVEPFLHLPPLPITWLFLRWPCTRVHAGGCTPHGQAPHTHGHTCTCTASCRDEENGVASASWGLGPRGCAPGGARRVWARGGQGHVRELPTSERGTLTVVSRGAQMALGASQRLPAAGSLSSKGHYILTRRENTQWGPRLLRSGLAKRGYQALPACEAGPLCPP